MKQTALYLLVLILLLTACGQNNPADEGVNNADTSAALVDPEDEPAEPTDDTQTTESSAAIDLVGLWDGSLAGEHGFMVFAEDGTFFLSLNQETVTSSPRVKGEYWLADGQLHLQDQENAGHWAECTAEGVYDIDTNENGSVKFVTVEDSCNEGGFTRNYVMENTMWTHVGAAP
jgi:hypothetical protein